MKRRMTLLLLCVALLVSAMAFTVSAEPLTSEDGSWEYTVDSGVATVTKYLGSDSEVTIPDTFGYYLVTAIGDSAFVNNATMTKINFPKALTSIGSYAFNGCVGLTSVTLPAKLTSLGDRAFQNCTRLTEIVVDCVNLNDLWWWGVQPFYGCGTAGDGITVTFAEGCTRVPAHMFYATDGDAAVPNIISVTMADTVTEIGSNAFRDCMNLKELTISNAVSRIGEYAFAGCSKLENVKLPDALTHIDQYAFSGCVGMTSVTLPVKLTSLGNCVFQNCTHLTEIVVDSVNLNDMWWWGVQPFYGCGSGSDGITVTFAEGCTRVPAHMFYAADGDASAPNIVSVMIADTVTEIGNNAFNGCIELKEVSIGSSVSRIGECAFYRCGKLEDVTLPDALTSIESRAFADCTSFTSVTLPSKLTSLGDCAFQNCTGLTEIIVDSVNLNDMWWWGVQPFYGCGSGSDGITVTFAEGCIRIPAHLFQAADGDAAAPNIIAVTVADTVTEIGKGAFWGDIYLDEITFQGDAPVMGEEIFGNVEATAYYPANNATWTDDVKQNYGGTITWVGYGPEIPEDEDKVIRVAGANRWETSLMVADQMKEALGVDKFDAIVIASGNNFADALTGSYLANVKSAPILLSWGRGGKYVYLDEDNLSYIRDNLKIGGTVYILGSVDAVPTMYEENLHGFQVKRLGGRNRFDTNLLILEEAGVKAGDEILICTGTNFADSLSASATGMPILLVFNESGKLFDNQKEYLSGLENCRFTILGGTSAVSEKLEGLIGAYGETSRLAGVNRFETSVLVAEKYFSNPDSVVLAYAWNFPDGLCGGSLAYAMKVPLVLTMTKYEAKAMEYVQNTGIAGGVILGSEALISDDCVRTIFGLTEEDTIIVK